MANISISEIRHRLGDEFCEHFERVFGMSIFEKILRGFSCERKPCIRINTLKTNVRDVMDFLREKNVNFERVSFLPDALIIKNKDEKFFEDLDIYKKGEIYFQGISSQLPAIFLKPVSGDKVLDLCAAPGSKTAQMAIMMGGIGEVLANEFDKIRIEKLKYTLEKQGIKIAKVVEGNGIFVGEKMPEYFDKVLVDAPCSAEGRIDISNPRSYKFWSKKILKSSASLQKRLVTSGFEALKKGGILAYSTCTLSPEENEGVVDSVLKKFGENVEILKLSLTGFEKNLLPIVASYDGVTFDKRVSNCIKAMPSEICEGFFVAVFRKK
ncbi:RsmB/NOP family class I SAM-dependent RNA methyltransferase [Candidatus Gracilibacteria bacterium]|jgi:16S rRNA (cytosine1407-C5)-methyltransferase|nr:RsmB/NOP family class I SAM-dependent RNA methyltransferase [Candidatus Gracilibacteria bacterium]